MLEVIEEASLDAEKPKEEPADAADKEQDVESEDSDDVFYENKVHFADKYLEIWIRSWKKPRIRIRLPYIVWCIGIPQFMEYNFRYPDTK